MTNDHILIVANESGQTTGLLRGLRGLGMTADLLPTARSAFAFCKDRGPAVVVLDKALPDLSGLNLCRLIKTEPRTSSAFVLLLLDEINDQLEAFELGAADCVMKPFDVRKLNLQIRNLIRSISGESSKPEELKDWRPIPGSRAARSQSGQQHCAVHPERICPPGPADGTFWPGTDQRTIAK